MAGVETRRLGEHEVRIVNGHAELPEGMRSVPARAFLDWDGKSKGCKSLKTVTIPSSVTSIGEDAFANCSSLSSVTIPSSVTSIDQLAFCNCSSLSSVTIPAEAVLGVNVFPSSTQVTKVTAKQMAAAQVHRAHAPLLARLPPPSLPWLCVVTRAATLRACPPPSRAAASPPVLMRPLDFARRAWRE